jgi:CRP-like cAMP-binding protein
MPDVHPLLRKLECFIALSQDERSTVHHLPGLVRTVGIRQPLTSEGSSPISITLLLEGVGCRTKQLADGRRQVISFLFPGDLTESHAMAPRALDHSSETLTECRVMEIDRATLLELMAQPAIGEALEVSAMVEEAITKEWLINVGRRASAERVAHLLCECITRLRAIGLAAGDRFPFPITQRDIADCTCLSVVHVNRLLQDFRTAGLVTLQDGELAIQDFERLRRVGGFSEGYLEISNAPPSPRATRLRPEGGVPRS